MNTSMVSLDSVHDANEMLLASSFTHLLGASSHAHNLLGVSHDLEAVQMWLRAKGARSAHTFDAYLKESRRFLIWLHEERLSLAALTVDDVHRYLSLLSQPPSHWLRPRKLRQGQVLAHTQLLVGPLSQKSLQYTQTVLGQMFSYLQHATYVQGNPFKLSIRFAVVDHHVSERILDLKVWRYLWTWVCQEESIRQDPATRRARWLLALLYHTGLRREEVARARMSDCLLRDHGWELQVMGKGRKIRRVTLNQKVLEELQHYRSHLGLTPLPTSSEKLSLVMSIHAKRADLSMTPRSIGLLVHQLMHAASMACEDYGMAQSLFNASTHWLRHTHATHRLAAGASLESTQDEMGHTDPKTTRIYAKVLDDQRRRDAEKLAQWSVD